jgi:predicted acetyltransferase
MSDRAEVVLQVATASDAPLLSNLLELYIHDLSEVFPSLELGSDGRYGYDKLPLYWSESERRFAFLIQSHGLVAGFVLATRGSPASEDPDVLDIAEFFVARSHRRLGVGRQAAFLLWKALPGRWTVRVYEANRAALGFWSRVIAEFAHGAAAETERTDDGKIWRVFWFESKPSAQ